MIKAIFWDNDGVLVDTERLYFQATQDIMAAAGRPLTEADYIEYFLRQGTGAWHLLDGISPDDVARLRAARNDRYSELLRGEACAIEGAENVLRQLHGHYTMGIVTSSRRDHFEIIHARCDLLRHVDFVLTADELPRTKPHPDPYRIAVERAGVNPGECVAVEDSERGLESATAAGIRCIVIPTPLTVRGDFSAATRVVDRIDEIPAALLDL
ncbi:MAG TPA: HAD family phosphatase [Vicinamibacterales bacterium]|nr:HAD family phosphatase [Vicinamibacterales bacterium]